MTNAQFRDIMKAEPFRPFAIELASGREIVVSHPEFVLPLKGGRTVIVASNRDDSFDVIDLMLVQNVRVPASNGAHSANH